MKYAILESNGSFFPMKRDWFTWKYFYRQEMGLDFTIHYPTLEEARSFLDKIPEGAQFKLSKVVLHNYP